MLALAACADDRRAEPRASERTPVPADAAAIAQLPPPPDAQPPAPEPEAPPEVGLITGTNRQTLDRIRELDNLPDLSKYAGLRPDDDRPSGSGAGVGDEPKGKVKLEGSTGDFAGLTREEVDRVVKSRKGMLQRCYQRELADRPELAGKLVVDFAIDEGGAVTRAKIGSASTLDDDRVETCVLRQIRNLKFPAKGGAIVRYPFVFSPG